VYTGEKTSVKLAYSAQKLTADMEKLSAGAQTVAGTSQELDLLSIDLSKIRVIAYNCKKGEYNDGKKHEFIYF